MGRPKKMVAPAPDLLRADPMRLSPSDLDALIRDCDRKIGLMQVFSQSEEWALTKKRLEARRDLLEHEMLGLRRRLVKPIAGQPVVTLEQIAYQEGRIEENRNLLIFPKMTLAIWGDQIRQLQMLRERPA